MLRPFSSDVSDSPFFKGSTPTSESEEGFSSLFEILRLPARGLAGGEDSPPPLGKARSRRLEELPIRTCNDSSPSRAPLHCGQASSPKKCLVPRPLHSGHAPYGELNENRRGSISGYEKPS